MTATTGICSPGGGPGGRRPLAAIFAFSSGTGRQPLLLGGRMWRITSTTTLLKGSDCNLTRPALSRVARNSPSPPKNMVDARPARSIENSISGSNATTQPVSIRSFSPVKCFSTMVQPACKNAIPSPRDVLEDESLAAEETGAELPVEGDVELGTPRRAEKGVPLGPDPATELREIKRHDLSRIRSCERNLTPAAALVGEVGQERRLARRRPLAGRLELPPSPLVGLRPVAHLDLESDAVLDIHHRPDSATTVSCGSSSTSTISGSRTRCA